MFKTWKRVLGIILGTSTLISCSSTSRKETLKEQEFPSDILKEIAHLNSERDMDSFQKTIDSLLAATYEKHQGHLFYQGETKSEEIDEESSFLRLKDNSKGRQQAFLVTENDFYEVDHFYFDEKKKENIGYTLIDYGVENEINEISVEEISVGMDIVDNHSDFFALNPVVEIAHIPGRWTSNESFSCTREEFDHFCFGATVEPLTEFLFSFETIDLCRNPKEYLFSLEPTPTNQYVWTITSPEKNIQDLKESDLLKSDIIMDYYLKITMDETGCISFLESHGTYLVIKGIERALFTRHRQLSVQSTTSEQETFLKDFFQEFKDGRLQIGDQITLFAPLDSNQDEL